MSRTSLHILPRWAPAFATLGLTSYGKLIDCFLGPAQTPHIGSQVVRRAVSTPDGPLDLFIKCYLYRPPSLKFLGRASKAAGEIRSYAAFQRLGIACAEPVAWGEERDTWGRLISAVIVTQAIPDSTTLVELFDRAHTSGRKLSPESRGRILEELAHLTRRMHEAGFFHHDLVWRNLLASPGHDGLPKLWCIDCPRGGFDAWSPWRRSKRLRDLAGLDKSATLFASNKERVAFLRLYLGRKKLRKEDKRLARDVVRYRLAH